LIPAFAGVLLSYVWLPLGNLVCWVARLALDVILAVARAGGSVSVTLPAPNAIAYLLWISAMVFASRLFLRSGKTRAFCAVLMLDASVLAWLLLNTHSCNLIGAL
jgi:hypothetical protein